MNATNLTLRRLHTIEHELRAIAANAPLHRYPKHCVSRAAQLIFGAVWAQENTDAAMGAERRQNISGYSPVKRSARRR